MYVQCTCTCTCMCMYACTVCCTLLLCLLQYESKNGNYPTLPYPTLITLHVYTCTVHVPLQPMYIHVYIVYGTMSVYVFCVCVQQKRAVVSPRRRLLYRPHSNRSTCLPRHEPSPSLHSVTWISLRYRYTVTSTQSELSSLSREWSLRTSVSE